MTTIPDDQLFLHSQRVEGKVVLITGAANGIGKEAALKFASYGAKIVIGDLDTVGAENTACQITNLGSSAVYLKCNVTVWDDLVALYELGIQKFGAIDVVVVNAGVAEVDGAFSNVRFDPNGKPLPPGLTTINVNLIGLLYTAHLALHYLTANRSDPDSLKAIVLMGSMSSWAGIPNGELYASSKHAVLGFMRSISRSLELKRVRIAVIHPWFADTAIVPTAVKVVPAGIPLTPLSRIAGAIFYSATNPDWETSGSAWLLTDDGPVLLVQKEEFKEGVYKMIDERANRLLKGVRGVVYYSRLVRDLSRIFGKPLLVLFLALATGRTSWLYRETLMSYLRS